MIEVIWKVIGATAWLAGMATWGGLLLLPLGVVAWLMIRRDPKAARWLFLLPLGWIAPLALATGMNIPYPTAPQVDRPVMAAWLSVVLCFLVAPAFAWERKMTSWRVIAWCALNLLCSLSALAVIGLMSFTT
jgi:hypothetical protein